VASRRLQVTGGSRYLFLANLPYHLLNDYLTGWIIAPFGVNVPETRKTSLVCVFSNLCSVYAASGDFAGKRHTGFGLCVLGRVDISSFVRKFHRKAREGRKESRNKGFALRSWRPLRFRKLKCQQNLVASFYLCPI
jgi:hypothetical protein